LCLGTFTLMCRENKFAQHLYNRNNELKLPLISTLHFHMLTMSLLLSHFSLACILPSTNSRLGSTVSTTCALSGFMEPMAMAVFGDLDNSG
jgi:hypothetical protein